MTDQEILKIILLDNFLQEICLVQQSAKTKSLWFDDLQKII